MLLVEDNQELREFLRSIFSPMYRVVEAADGKEGQASFEVPAGYYHQ